MWKTQFAHVDNYWQKDGFSTIYICATRICQNMIVENHYPTISVCGLIIQILRRHTERGVVQGKTLGKGFGKWSFMTAHGMVGGHSLPRPSSPQSKTEGICGLCAGCLA